MNNETAQRIIAIAARELGIPEDEITPESILSVLFSDSLDYTSFLLCLKEIGECPDSLVAKAETIGELADGLIVSN